MVEYTSAMFLNEVSASHKIGKSEKMRMRSVRKFSHIQASAFPTVRFLRHAAGRVVA